MAWTAPRTWVAGEVVTAAIGNTHWRDNLRYLRGLDGVVTIDSGLIIDNTDGDEYLQIPSLTTTERNALTPVNGMIIYNETTTEFNKYEAGAWVDLADNTDHGGLDGLADDDHTQYQKESLLTTAGDIPYATGASTWARLGIGTASQYLRTNAGATAPEWAVAGAGGFAPFGDGSDGDVTISGDTTLSRDMFYDNLTVDATKVLTTAGYRVFVKNTLTNNGTIRRDGNAGVGITGGAALAEGSLGGSSAGGNGNSVVAKTSGGGGSGGGVVLIVAKTIVNTSGIISANGGVGGNGSGTEEGANNGTAGSAIAHSLGGNGGAGGTKDGIGGTGGAVTAPTAGVGGFRALPFASILKEIETTVFKVAGGGGGGGGGNSNTGGFGACGGGGGGGGLVVLVYNSLAAGTEQASGGAGGAPSADAVAGDAGSAGTVIKIIN